MNNPFSYNGNPYVKRDGVEQSYTEHELSEYIKCSESAEYFIENYVQIISLNKGLVKFTLRGYQCDMVKHFNDNRFSVVLACRQSGKSITSVAFLLWFILFNPTKTVGILANKGATAREMLARLTLMLENVPFFLQPGCKVLNKGSIKFSNNSTIIAASTSASSIRGLSMDCVSGNTKVCIETEEGIFYTEIYNFINNDMKRELVEKDHYLVYKTTNLVNNKIYIGFHSTNNINDGYLGSGKLIRKAIAKYGPNNFRREILFDFKTKEEAEAKEEELVTLEFVDDENNYNITPGGNITILHGDKNGFFNKSHSNETKNQISIKKSGVNNTKLQLKIFKNDIPICWFLTFLEEIDLYYPELKGKNKNETKRNVLLACGNKDHELNFKELNKQQICEQLFNKENLRDRYKEKQVRYSNLSDKLKGQKKPDDFGKKISIALTGKTKTLIHINKINKNLEKIHKTAEKHRGMKRSLESKLRMSKAAKKRPCNNKGKKYFINPNNLYERGYFNIDEAPIGWLNKTKL